MPSALRSRASPPPTSAVRGKRRASDESPRSRSTAVAVAPSSDAPTWCSIRAAAQPVSGATASSRREPSTMASAVAEPVSAPSTATWVRSAM